MAWRGFVRVPFVAAVYPLPRSLRPALRGHSVVHQQAGGFLRGGGQRVAALLGSLAVAAAQDRRLAGTAYGLGTCCVEFEQPGTVAARPMEFFLALERISCCKGTVRARLLVGLSYALAFVCRPTAAVAVAAAAIYYLVCDRRALLRSWQPACRGPAAGGIQPARVWHAHRVGQVNVGAATAAAPARSRCCRWRLAATHGSTATATQMFHTIAAAKGWGIFDQPLTRFVGILPGGGVCLLGLVRASGTAVLWLCER